MRFIMSHYFRPDDVVHDDQRDVVKYRGTPGVNILSCDRILWIKIRFSLEIIACSFHRDNMYSYMENKIVSSMACTVYVLEWPYLQHYLKSTVISVCGSSYQAILKDVNPYQMHPENLKAWQQIRSVSDMFMNAR